MKLEDFKHPGSIMESVHSDHPEAPQIKIRLADSDEENEDDATITMDLGNEEDGDDDDEEEEEEVFIRPKKLPKSKTDDIHSFL